jgi:hypothetical protein
MQISNVISDLVLATAAFFVFFRFLNKLNLTNTVLWESFVLSVAVSAAFGAVRSAGFANAGLVSTIFQRLATITGAVGLVGAAYGLIKNIDFSKQATLMILGFGMFLFFLSEGLSITQISQHLPTIAMLAVAALGVYGLLNGKKPQGIWLLAAVGCFAWLPFVPSFLVLRGFSAPISFII